MPYLYPKNIESKIGFDSIRTLLKSHCDSALGQAYVDELSFSSDISTIKFLLGTTEEMKGLLESGADLPEAPFNELSSWLPSLRVPGAYASPQEYLRLSASIAAFENIKNFFKQRKGQTEDTDLVYPLLSELFNPLNIFPNLVYSIHRIIDKTGNVKDSASPELAEVRQKLSSMQGAVARAIQRIYSNAVKEGIADKDAGPTYRDGRMVVPVAAANKRQLSGIVHDESASGKTVFIEPSETVELSNRMRELELEEQRIIVRILIAIADEIRPFINEILESNHLLGQLDFILAKAKFAIDINAAMPLIENRPEIDWYGAIHPGLLISLRRQGKKVVPLNIRLDNKKRILIISGPNAGGKSVTLKTAGIIQYMLQCGILPSVHSNSHVGIFNKIFIDIGDEQSIENDLSTYSSHLRNMRVFLLHADRKSLVLIDEIGSGTEPNIGSAIAKSILVELAESRCYGIITTHYHNLKRFAEEDQRFINGAMLYDRQRLQPTFQLSIGNAGSSFAIEIATKIGLPKSVLDKAKQEVGEEYVESDKFMMEIARDRKYWQEKRNSIKERERRLENLAKKYTDLIGEINQRRKEIIKEAQSEAEDLLSGANKRIENTIIEIRKIEAEKQRTKEIRKELESFKEKIEKADKKEVKLSRLSNPYLKKIKKSGRQQERQPSDIPSANPKELSTGNFVKMDGTGTIGEILKIAGKNAVVAFGSLQMTVGLDRLKATPKPTIKRDGKSFTLLGSDASDASRQRQLSFKDELDIRGARADEALDKLIHFIDDAIQFGVKKVRILHGTGAGILRQLVRQQLSATPGVVKFEDEDVRIGGTGITVVTL